MKLGEVTEFKYGKSLPARNRKEGDVPVYGSGGITGFHDEHLIEGPGVIVGRKGSIGTVYYENKDFYPIDTVFYLKHDPDKIDQKFLYFYLKDMNLENMNTDAAVPGLNREVALSQEISIPALQTQQKIASILSAFDDLIENNTRRIAILEETARLIYREWFVHYRYPGHENDRLVDSGTDLGDVPEGWGVSKIIDLYDTSAGGTPSRKKEEYYKGHIPWLKTRELNDSFVQETEEYITDLGLKNSSAKLFPKQSVLVAMYGATVGKMGILDMDAATNQACCAIMEKEEPFDFSYLFFTLLQHREKFVGLSQGAAQQNINQGHIKDFQILKPDDSVLLKFQNTVLPMLDQIRTLKKQSKNLKRTRDLLLPKLISGKVGV